MKRTTIRLDDNLMAAAKQRAADRGTTLTALIERAVREVVARDIRASRPAVELPTFRGRGVQPGVDLADNKALRDLMDRGVPLDKLG